MSDAPKLKPCPFCGGDAVMNYGGFGERFVTCDYDNCGGRLGTGIWFTDEEAAAECEKNFGVQSSDETHTLVCDEYYLILVPWASGEGAPPS